MRSNFDKAESLGKAARATVFVLLSTLLAAVWPVWVFAEDAVVDTLVIAGVDSVTAAEASSLLLSRKGGVLNDGLVEHDIRALETYMREKGLWNASVGMAADSLDTGAIRLTFTIVPGDPVYFGRFVSSAEGEKLGDVIPGENDYYGGLFSRAELERAVREIVAGYAGAGFPDVTVAPSLSAVGDTVDVALRIVSGAQAHIDSIAVAGLTRTRNDVIRRELAFLVGEAAVNEAIDEAADAISRLKYVRLTKRPELSFTHGRGILMLELGEGNQGVFDGVLGYQPEPDGKGGAFVGKIDLGFDNLFGTGRVAGFRWENLGEGTEDLEVGFTEPWIFGRPYSVGASFTQEERELRGYTRTILNGTIGRTVGRLALDAGFRYEKVSADSLDSSSGSGIEGRASWTAMDNRMNPSRGVRYSVMWSSIAKRYRFGGRDNTRIDRIALDFDQYIPARKHQTAALLLKYRRVMIPDAHLTASDRYWLGGSTTIRGHGESMYPAVKALWGSAEYRFLTGEDSRVFVFVDTGWLMDREKEAGRYEKKIRRVTGYGFGLRLTSKAGVLGFDYGLASGDGPGDGKVHVSMRTEF